MISCRQCSKPATLVGSKMVCERGHKHTCNVFIAGPMTGYENYNFAAFEAASAKLTEAGFDVRSAYHLFADEVEMGVVRTRDYYLRLAMRELTYCEAIYLLDGWTASDGAMGEVAFAMTARLHRLNILGEVIPMPKIVAIDMYE